VTSIVETKLFFKIDMYFEPEGEVFFDDLYYLLSSLILP